MEKIEKIVFDLNGKKHEFSGNGGGSGSISEGSVGSEEIKDGSLKLEDMSDEVMRRLNPENDESYTEDSDIEELFDETEPSAGD